MIASVRWLCCLVLMSLFGGSVTCLLAEESRFRVVGYLPDYRAGVVELDVVQSLTDLTLFSVELNPDGSLNEKRWTTEHWNATQALRSRKGLRTQVCVGGWDRSDSFAVICQTPAARKRLGKELLQYCQRHSLKGVNLDWEHPSTAAQQASFATLLVELKPVFQAADLELSIAVAPSQKLPKEAWEAVEFVMLMSYDDAGKHSTFESCQKHLGMLLDQGVPASKVVLCVPLYGRKVENREALTYAQIVAKYSPRPDLDEVDGIFFNGPGTITAKTAWAQSIGLAGVAVWELGQDAPGDAALLHRIRKVVR